MSFQDPPSRPRYPALGQYEEARSAPDYADAFDGSGYQSNGAAAGGWAAAQTTYDGATQASYDGLTQVGYTTGTAQVGYSAANAAGSGYGPGNGSAYQANGYQANGYQANGYQANGYQAGNEFAGAGGGYSTATLQRPADDSWRELLDEDWESRRRRPEGGLLAGALAGFLAVAVALGIATLVAAFLRPQASPVMAAGQAFINHAPSSLKSFALHSKHERKALFAVMFAIIAVIAMIIGMFAQRKVAIGVAGIVLIGLFGAFVTIHQQGSRASDAVPAVIGAIAGVAALTLLIRSFYADNTTRGPARRRG